MGASRSIQSCVQRAIGTYVNQRGGNIYPSLIRKFEPKAIRVYLQDGSADHNIVGGNWFLANQEMESALTFAGYEVNHTWGTGDHDAIQATAILPVVMRWLWKDWPTPPKAGLGSEPLQQILIPGELWRMAPANIPIANPFEVTAANGEKFHCDSTGIWITRSGKESLVVSGGANGLTLSPDQSLLYVGDGGHWVYSYQIQGDGSLGNMQRFYDLYAPDNVDDPSPSAMCVDRDGRLYVATRAGVQICDQTGRVLCIIPIEGENISNVWFGGDNLDELYARCGRKRFVRKLKVRGVNAADGPIKPKAPRL